MTIAKPYPSDPSLRDSRVADGESLPVTAPTAAPGGDPSPNSVRAREEGLGVKPDVTEANLNALAELAATAADDENGHNNPTEAAAVDPEADAKREAANARRREQRAAKKAAAEKAKKAAK